jgi:hypothetical protein
MEWVILALIYLSITFKVAIDTTDYDYYDRTFKDVLVHWIGAILAIPFFFMVVIVFLKVTS